MRYLRVMLIVVAVAIACAPLAQGEADGSGDVLRLSNAALRDGEFSVEVHVINHKELAGLDIPIRFGRPGDATELLRVEFARRVEEWDFTHAQINNHEKTVILGLISELTGVRAGADLKVSAPEQTLVATLVFAKPESANPEFSAFETKGPTHQLTFLYNETVDGKLEVRSYTPDFEVDVEYKASILPTSYALSQNYPNPFNPSTSFTLSLPEASEYSIRVINIAGQLVKTMEGRLEAGVHTITWDGSNDQGARVVASGVYVLQAQAGAFSQTRKMVMLK